MLIPRILFFIAGTTPTLEQQVEAEGLAPCKVAFRNVNFISPTDRAEKCDGWMGDATPKIYRDTLSTAEEAIKAYTDYRKQVQQDVRDKIKAKSQTEAERNEASAERAAEVAKEKVAKAEQVADKTAQELAAAKAKADANWTNNA